MQRLAVILVAAVIMSLVAGLKPNDADAHSGYWQVNAGNGLNVRTGPGGSYARIETMPNGTVVKAYGHRGSWLKMRDTRNGIIGWAWLAYFVPYSAPASSPPASGGGYCMWNYWNEYVCASANVANAIRYWAAQYGLGTWGLFGTAACESSFNIYAYNSISGVTGLFQFEPSTFYAWGGSNLYDPWDQSRIAAKMFAAGEARQYYCAILIGYA